MKTKKTKPVKDYKFSRLQKKWIEALESGKYKQGTGYLCQKGPDGQFRYCCLGVLCETYNSSHKTNPIKKNLEITSIIDYESQIGLLPDKVYRAAKLYSSGGMIKKRGFNNLMILNDIRKWSFKQIASFIKENPTAVFSND